MNQLSVNPKNNKAFLLLTFLGVSILVIGGGLYEVEAMPKDEYLVSMLAIILLIISYICSKEPNFIEPSLIIGYTIFNVFFCIRLFFSDYQEVEIKTYLLHFISLGLFIAFYTATKILLASADLPRRILNLNVLQIIIFAALAILLIGQIIQIYTTDHTFISRPGGYLNPNSTAALALMFLYTITLMNRQKNQFLLFTGITLSSVIILITQSRASLLILLPYLFYTMLINRGKALTWTFIALLFIALGIMLSTQPDLYNFTSTIADRFKGDHNSDARADIALTGLSDFLKAPIMGHGYQHIATTYSLGSHNQIIEILASYGILGIALIGTACYFLYVPFSILFLIFCIIPTLIFSHNYFEIYHFQAVMGLTLAIDRYYTQTKIND